MDSVLRAAAVYVFVLLLFRITGKRSLSQITTFDFVLLLIVSEATQQALLGDDFSIVNAFIVIGTMIGINIALSEFKRRWNWLEKVLEDTPLVLVENGKLHRDRMEKERVDEDDILSSARKSQGLERLDQIKYAVLEREGQISIIPRSEEDPVGGTAG